MRARRVHIASTIVYQALIDICAGFPIAPITWITRTFTTTIDVRAERICVTAPVIAQGFIDIEARFGGRLSGSRAQPFRENRSIRQRTLDKMAGVAGELWSRKSDLRAYLA